MVNINIFIAILLLPAAYADDEELSLTPTKTFSAVFDPEDAPNFLAFFTEEEGLFDLTIQTDYDSKEVPYGIPYTSCPKDKTKQWNIISIAEKKLNMFGQDIDFNTACHRCKQNVSITSKIEMIWKACPSITECPLPLSVTALPIPLPVKDNSITEEKGRRNSTSTILAVICLVLTAVTMILVIYIIREKREPSKVVDTKPSGKGQGGKGVDVAIINLPEHHTGGSNDPNEHVYEEIDEFTIPRESMRPESVHESEKSLYGASI